MNCRLFISDGVMFAKGQPLRGHNSSQLVAVLGGHEALGAPHCSFSGREASEPDQDAEAELDRVAVKIN